MQRKEKGKSKDGEIRWRKIGGGSFRFHGKIIKPGQIFSANPNEISKNFRDVIIPVDELPEEKVIEGAEAKYTIDPKSRGWYDVVDASGKIMNESSLRKGDAEKLIKELEQ